MKQLSKDDIEKVKASDLKPGMVTPDGIVTATSDSVYDERLMWVQYTSSSRHCQPDLMVDVIAIIDTGAFGS